MTTRPPARIASQSVVITGLTDLAHLFHLDPAHLPDQAACEHALARAMVRPGPPGLALGFGPHGIQLRIPDSSVYWLDYPFTPADLDAMLAWADCRPAGTPS